MEMLTCLVLIEELLSIYHKISLLLENGIQRVKKQMKKFENNFIGQHKILFSVGSILITLCLTAGSVVLILSLGVISGEIDSNHVGLLPFLFLMQYVNENESNCPLEWTELLKNIKWPD